MGYVFLAMVRKRRRFRVRFGFGFGVQEGLDWMVLEAWGRCVTCVWQGPRKRPKHSSKGGNHPVERNKQGIII